MKEILETEIYGNKLAVWLVAIFLVSGSVLTSRVVYWFIAHFVKRRARLRGFHNLAKTVDLMEEPILTSIVIISIGYALTPLSLSDWFNRLFDVIIPIALVFNIAWFVIRMANYWLVDWLLPYVEKSQGKIRRQMLSTMRQIIRWTIWLLAASVSLQIAGYDVRALLAGMGIGGVAVALAAKETVSNLFGGVTVLVDKPFRVGDRIIVSNFDGYVEEIGLRSTRLRTMAGRLVTIPNFYFTSSMVENVSMEPNRRVSFQVLLHKETTPQKISIAIAQLKNILQKHGELLGSQSVNFEGFETAGYKIVVVYFIIAGLNYNEIQTKINLEVALMLEQEGIKLG